MLIIWKFPKIIAGRTKRLRGPRVWDSGLEYGQNKLTTLAFIDFEWLKIIEPNSTTLCDLSIRSKSVHPLASADIFPGGDNIEILLYPFQVADDAIQMDVQKTLYAFYPISLCRSNLNSQSFVWNVFYASFIRNTFSFRIITWAVNHNRSCACKEMRRHETFRCWLFLKKYTLTEWQRPGSLQ